MTFNTWIKGKGRPFILTPIITFIFFVTTTIFIPFLTKEILNDPKKAFESLSWFLDEKHYMALGYLLQILFIVYAIFTMRSHYKPIGHEKDGQIKEFIIKKFGSESELGKKDGEFLKNAINKNLNQFYLLWLCVWLLWFILYCIVWGRLDNEENGVLVILQNVMNISTSLLFLFMYRMLSKKSVKSSGGGQAQTDLGNFQWIAGAVVLTIIDILVNNLIDDKSNYEQAEFLIKFLIGLFSSIGFMAVIGRLNSKFINVPNEGLAVLYFYAAIQMLYPFEKNVIASTFTTHTHIFTTILTSVALCCKIIFFYLMTWIFETGRLTYFIICESNLNRQEDENFNDFSNMDIF